MNDMKIKFAAYVGLDWIGQIKNTAFVCKLVITPSAVLRSFHIHLNQSILG